MRQATASTGHAGTIRRLNDAFRRSLCGDQVVITQGLAATGGPFVQMAVNMVRRFDAFDPDNDPHGEHDFGSVEIQGTRVFFKIDYYDPTLASGSENPADLKLTSRIMTLMLAEEY